MPESGPFGSVRGVPGNGHPYRAPRSDPVDGGRSRRQSAIEPCADPGATNDRSARNSSPWQCDCAGPRQATRGHKPPSMSGKTAAAKRSPSSGVAL